MNLIRIHIENFKQFVDPLDIEIPQQATIGVIGTNGVGKTTLFQAIEWCLYNPPSISGRDIRPRGRSGNPKVSITLESRDGSKRWIVEREQKRAAATAKVYEVKDDGTETLIVQGSPQVTEFVSTRLIDLTHTAFVATFFTRQKELHFFGDMGSTERRREVGKLLGLGTIRRAQTSIREEQNEAASSAKNLREQYAAEIGERDLKAELASIEELIATSKSEIERTGDAESAATDTVNRTKAQLAAAQVLRDRHAEVRNRLERAQSDQSDTKRRHEQRIGEITRLEQSKLERESLVPVAAELDALQAQVGATELERQRHLQKTQIERDLAANATSRTTNLANLIAEVRKLDRKNADPAWIWHEEDAKNVPAAVARLQSVAAARPVETAERTLELLTRARHACESAANAQTRLDNYIGRREELVKQREAALKGGDPNIALAAIGESVSKLNSTLTAWTAERKEIDADLSKRQRVLSNIRMANFDDGCPTCGRKFSEEDEHVVSETFSSAIAIMHDRILTGDQRAQMIAADIKSFEEGRETHSSRSKALSEVENGISKSVGFIEEQQLLVVREREAADEALKIAGLTQPPAVADIEIAEKQLNLARVLREAIGRVQIHAGNINHNESARMNIERELAAFADVSFDQNAYAALTAARDNADRAKTRIDGFDRELKQLPAAIKDRDELRSILLDIELSIASIKQELFEVGFDPELLQAAGRAVVAAEQAERQAMQHHQQAELAHQKAVSTKENIDREHSRIRDIVVRADRLQRETDELNQMYTLFGEFEQFVVARLTPALSEMTSELVSQVTGGKYDDVSFDDNFGVLVADGDENPFPLASFSGGERDAIALCARLALSQMIGLQAAEQPGFLVLDEVFGSLDRDRRGRMLELFGNLSTVSDRFQQVFIISHVEDVKVAPNLDEVWRVQENDEGKSTIENLTPGTDIGEF